MSPSRIMLTVAIVIVGISRPAFIVAQQTYSEDFKTVTYKDTLNTTAQWDTAAGELRMFPLIALAGAYDTPDYAWDVTLAGDLAFVADGTTGLIIIDITDPTLPTLAGSYDTPGYAYGVVVAGDLAFVADGTSGLVIVDITDPTTPVLAGAYNTPGEARSVAVAGDLAFVADHAAGGLQVIDISDPSTPTLAGTYDTPGTARGVAVAGDIAFVADYDAGLHSIDISDPMTPTLAGTYNTAGFALAVTVDGDHAFVADHAAGLQVIDITDPTTLTLAGTYDTPGNAWGVAVDGDLAFVADHELGGLQVIDISDPTAPTLAGLYDMPGWSRGVAVDGPHAFVADGGAGLTVVTVRDPVTPVITGTHVTAAGAAFMTVAGNHAFVADYAVPAWFLPGALEIIDISDPSTPTFAGSLVTPGSPWDVVVDGDLALVADDTSGVQLIDVSDPTNPTLAGNYDTPDYAYGVAVAGDLAVVADASTGLIVLDISDPTAPSLTGTYTAPGGSANGVALAGDLALVADYVNGLLLVDISDPTSPTLTGNYETNGPAYNVVVAGDLALVAEVSLGLEIIDISDPVNPTLAGAYDTPGFAYDLAVAGDLALVTEREAGLQIIDISDPTNPTLVHTLDTPGLAYGVAVAGDFAFVGDGTLGFRAVRVFQHEVAMAGDVGQSLTVDAAADTILRARLTSTETAGVAWELSADGGSNWHAVLSDNMWNAFTVTGSDLLWRSTHTWSPGVNPTVSDLTIDWLTHFAPITSIVDVPADQGGWVYLTLRRSGHDFANEVLTPVTGYNVYQRVDLPAVRSEPFAEPSGVGRPWTTPDGVEAFSLPGEDVVVSGGVTYVRAQSGPETAATFPPGTWALIATAFATQTDDYIVKVPTATDSSAAGTNYSVYLVTTHTTTPSLWYASHPDSGYSVDNIAPAVPQNLAAAYNTGSGNQLSWDAAPEEDFQYYRIYRSSDPNFTPGPSTFVEGTIATTWTDPDNDGGVVYYRVTAVDDADNESDPASPGTATSVPAPAVPEAFALHQNYPNPFNPTTVIRYDVPRGGAEVKLRIYDVSGGLVRTLVDGMQAEGERQATWDGRDNQGRRVATGTYFYRLTAPGFEQTRKMVLLK